MTITYDLAAPTHGWTNFQMRTAQVKAAPQVNAEVTNDMAGLKLSAGLTAFLAGTQITLHSPLTLSIGIALGAKAEWKSGLHFESSVTKASTAAIEIQALVNETKALTTEVKTGVVAMDQAATALTNQGVQVNDRTLTAIV